MAKARSLREFQTSFADETSCAAFLFERRWPQGVVCPACGAGRAALEEPGAHLRMARLRSPDVGNGRDGDAPVEVAADGVVLGIASHGDALQWHVGSPARGPARHHLQDGLVAGAEAATIDDRSPPRAAGGRGGGRPGRNSIDLSFWRALERLFDGNYSPLISEE